MPCSLIQIMNSKKKGGHDSIKCFIAVLILEGSLYFVCTRIGLS